MRRCRALVGIVVCWVAVGGVAACGGDDRVRAGLGALEVASDVVDFGQATLGVAVERRVRVRQVGLLPAEVTSVRMQPGHAFRVDHLTERLAPGATDELRLTFLPMTAGPLRARLMLTVLRGPDVELDLAGEGLDARVTPPTALDFGRPVVGDERTRVVTLRNDAPTSVPVTATFVGADAAEFSAAVDVVVAPFSTSDVVLRYRPLGRAGARDAQLIWQPCPLCARTVTRIAADAVVEPVPFDPSPLELGGVQIDAVRSHRVLATNLTDEPLAVQSFGLRPGADAGFGLEAPAFPMWLLPLSGEAFDVRFSPTRPGDASAQVDLVTDLEVHPLTSLSLRASGGGAQLVVTPERLGFKATPVGGLAVMPLVLGNGAADPGAAPLRILAVEVTGDGFSGAGPATPFLLGAGERLSYAVQFSPGSAGPQTGRVRIVSDDGWRPEAGVTLAGEGTAGGDCALEATPPAVEFGNVTPGRGATLGARVTNVGDVACTLWDGAVTGDDAFSLAKPRPLVRLAPGDAVFVPIAYRPTLPGRHAATAVFQTSRPGMTPLDIPLTGGSVVGCLSPEPPYLDFGRRRVDCGPAEQQARFVNRCPGDIDVTSVIVGDSPEPGVVTIAGHSALPRRLGRGDAVDVQIRFTPGTRGFLAAPLFALASDVPWPWLTSVTGESLPPADHAQRWLQPSPGKLDLLWVVDNTASMADERARVLTGASAMLSSLGAAGIDWQLGVTTTGLGPAPSSGDDCPGGAHGGETGRLFPVDHSGPRLLMATMPDPLAVLPMLLDVGGCHSVEQGLEAAVRALSPPLVDHADDPRTPEPDDGNLGVRRADAALAVVVVSDEDDESPRTVDVLVSALSGVSGGAPFALGAVVAPEGGCPTAVEPGKRYLDAAVRTGGASASVCGADWSPLVSMAAGLLEPRRRFLLEADADVRTLVVRVDGLLVSDWNYDVAGSSLVFDAAPAPGRVVEATYREPCPVP